VRENSSHISLHACAVRTYIQQRHSHVSVPCAHDQSRRPDQVRRLGARAAKRVEIILGCPRDSKEISAFCLQKDPHAAFRSRLCILLDCEVNEWHVTIGCTLFPPESRSTRCLAVAVKLVKQIFGTLLATGFALFVREPPKLQSGVAQQG